jgi:four helix bundle protein
VDEARGASVGGVKGLRVYQLAYRAAMEVFRHSRSFPAEERYSLVSQIRRSARSVAANIAEGYRKRQYPAMFSSKLADADGEATETRVWLDFARDCGYLTPEIHQELTAAYDEVGRMLHSVMSDPEEFAPR